MTKWNETSVSIPTTFEKHTYPSYEAITADTSTTPAYERIITTAQAQGFYNMYINGQASALSVFYTGSYKDHSVCNTYIM